ncbi:sigma-70 family RNA polymerase sigma factor [Salinispora sp. H7-4]|uniref:sigma-70 family RNA polymerase sigma factor n=1 Tax=Salinispora sp. H7-4 TaxID=2748321 RepID=UPI0015D1B9E3|nr:sigma-70 family RNA polymerase sigma factor [Salinispora sp. H7-4]NYT92239.1 sigma-70 family RNA polymerase sigma factor [Salinispora sp. H7-4]
MATVGADASQPDAERSTAILDDEDDFAALVERHRRELHVHCYRMLGSFEDAEDLVQETYLRAWRKRETFEGRSSVRAWLYRIATNVCLDFLRRNARTPAPYRQPALGAGPSTPPPPTDEVPWLQPFPDHLLEPVAPAERQPDSQIMARETIELAFLVAIQHLPPQQRAVLILRDVLNWPAIEAAAMLDISVASANSALQRARATLKDRLPPRPSDWGPAADPAAAERTLVQRCIETLENADAENFAKLLREDVRVTMPPDPLWFVGRDVFVAGLVAQFDPASPAYFGSWRALPAHANGQPAIAGYVRRPGESIYRPQVLNVFRIEEGMIAEITAFSPEVFASFNLPESL